MRLIVEGCVQRCGHDGLVANTSSQSWVRVTKLLVLVATDPEGRPIAMCPNYGVNIKPCTTTLPVREGYSTFLAIDRHAVCLDTVVGYTDGTPPGAVDYTVRSPGQQLVGSTA